MSEAASYPFTGAEALRDRLDAALRGVIDPEMALNIVDLGLVYGVEAGAGGVRVRVTMTSAACPVAEMIVDDATRAIREIVGEETPVHVELEWDPPWTPERMSPAARHAMGWD